MTHSFIADREYFIPNKPMLQTLPDNAVTRSYGLQNAEKEVVIASASQTVLVLDSGVVQAQMPLSSLRLKTDGASFWRSITPKPLSDQAKTIPVE